MTQSFAVRIAKNGILCHDYQNGMKKYLIDKQKCFHCVNKYMLPIFRQDENLRRLYLLGNLDPYSRSAFSVATMFANSDKIILTANPNSHSVNISYLIPSDLVEYQPESAETAYYYLPIPKEKIYALAVDGDYICILLQNKILVYHVTLISPSFPKEKFFYSSISEKTASYIKLKKFFVTDISFLPKMSKHDVSLNILFQNFSLNNSSTESPVSPISPFSPLSSDSPITYTNFSDPINNSITTIVSSPITNSITEPISNLLNSNDISLTNDSSFNNYDNSPVLISNEKNLYLRAKIAITIRHTVEKKTFSIIYQLSNTKDNNTRSSENSKNFKLHSVLNHNNVLKTNFEPENFDYDKFIQQQPQFQSLSQPLPQPQFEPRPRPRIRPQPFDLSKIQYNLLDTTPDYELDRIRFNDPTEVFPQSSINKMIDYQYCRGAADFDWIFENIFINNSNFAPYTHYFLREKNENLDLNITNPYYFGILDLTQPANVKWIDIENKNSVAGIPDYVVPNIIQGKYYLNYNFLKAIYKYKVDTLLGGSNNTTNSLSESDIIHKCEIMMPLTVNTHVHINNVVNRIFFISADRYSINYNYSGDLVCYTITADAITDPK